MSSPRVLPGSSPQKWAFCFHSIQLGGSPEDGEEPNEFSRPLPPLASAQENILASKLYKNA